MEQTAQTPSPIHADEAGKTPDGLLIRAAAPGDAEALAAITNLPKYRSGTLRLPYETPEEWRKRIAGKDAGDLLLVAELDDAVVGSAGLHRLTGRRAHAAMIGMGVHDDFHGRGIGRALLAALIEAADRWLGVRRLELTVFVDNTPAIRLYESVGFEAEGTLKAYAFRDGRFADALAMARLTG